MSHYKSLCIGVECIILFRMLTTVQFYWFDWEGTSSVSHVQNSWSKTWLCTITGLGMISMKFLWFFTDATVFNIRLQTIIIFSFEISCYRPESDDINRIIKKRQSRFRRVISHPLAAAVRLCSGWLPGAPASAARQTQLGTTRRLCQEDQVTSNGSGTLWAFIDRVRRKPAGTASRCSYQAYDTPFNN
jgi:hypothetical protein